MSESAPIDISKLHHIVIRESENDSVQEIDQNFYADISDFLGNLKKQEFDGIENKIKNMLIQMTTELTKLLLEIRLEKISKLEKISFENLLDEEKFILDSHEEKHERVEIILSAVLNGKSKLLESISQNHKTRRIVVRFLKEVDEILGADLEKYGPFKTEDIATIPYENAQALISKNVATKIRWED